MALLLLGRVQGKKDNCAQNLSVHKMITIHTDGACKGNPGPGGWAAIIGLDEYIVELAGYDEATTNNRMEMMAVIAALEYVQPNSSIHIVSDSEYVINGATKWMAGWIKRNWNTKKKNSVKNIDLWQRMNLSMATHDVTFEWVRGHSCHWPNERADHLANKAIEYKHDFSVTHRAQEYYAKFERIFPEAVPALR